MRIAYFDCASGISGDMCLGALVDAGASIRKLKEALKQIPISGYALSSSHTTRCGISATKVDVKLLKSNASNGHHQAKRWQDIRRLIRKSSLDKAIQDKGLEIFKMLFEAEGRVHGEPFDKVHLHELGAVDCIVDIFGTLTCLKLLGIDSIYSSAVNLGGGTVRTSHGILPVPTPATLEILKGRQVYSSHIHFEMTTPTGSVLLKALSKPSEPVPRMTIQNTGYGAGSKDFHEMPNVLRVIIGEVDSDRQALDTNDRAIVIETNIDDMNPQHYECVMDRLLSAGALDVFMENIIMKKGRPAVKLTCITRESDVTEMSDILFENTTSIGIRYYSTNRMILDREIRAVQTKYGNVRFKVSRIRGKIITVTPEYEDLKVIAENKNLSIKRVAFGLSHCYKNLFK